MPPVLLADLFPEVTGRLLGLLRSLSSDEWHLATVSSRRTVKDIAWATATGPQTYPQFRRISGQGGQGR
jgi:hypothetical protein